MRHIRVTYNLIFLFFGHFVNENTHREINEYGALARVDAAFEHLNVCDGSHIKCFIMCNIVADAVFGICLLGQQAQLIFVSHCVKRGNEWVRMDVRPRRKCVAHGVILKTKIDNFTL